MNVKKVGMALALAAAMSLPVLAQQNTPSANDQGWKNHHDPCARINSGKVGKRQGRELDRMAKQLSLTDQQKDQVKSLRDDTHSQVVDVCKDSSLNQQQKMDKIRDLRKSQHEKMMALLTPDQQAKMKQLRGGRHHHGGMKNGGTTGNTTTTPPANPQ